MGGGQGPHLHEQDFGRTIRDEEVRSRRFSSTLRSALGVCMSHASLAEEDWLARSPRRNLRQLLTRALGDDGAQCSEEEMQQHVALLQRADAENKLGRRKLYLLLDLDETLVFAQRLRAGASPAGHLIHVRGEAFDLQLRPGCVSPPHRAATAWQLLGHKRLSAVTARRRRGSPALRRLSHFLSTTGESFIMYLYTMGDEEYVKAHGPRDREGETDKEREGERGRGRETGRERREGGRQGERGEREGGREEGDRESGPQAAGSRTPPVLRPKGCPRRHRPQADPLHGRRLLLARRPVAHAQDARAVRRAGWGRAGRAGRGGLLRGRGPGWRRSLGEASSPSPCLPSPPSQRRRREADGAHRRRHSGRVAGERQPRDSGS